MNTRAVEQATSMRAAILGMIPQQAGVVMGRVIKASPLKIQAVNDPKLILEGGILVVPRWLTDSEYDCEIEVTGNVETSEGPVTARLRADKIRMGNHLQAGDSVILLEIGGGRKYLVVDKEG